MLLLLTTVVASGCSPAGKGDLNTYFKENIQKAGFVGLQAACIKNGELEWAGSFGLSNFISSEAVNDSTLFMIASCSKPVTAIAMMKLYEKRLVGLDVDINDYLPFTLSNPNHPDKIITIRMLLAHTSSLMDNWDILTPLYTLETGGGDSPISLSDLNKSYFLPGGQYYDSTKNFSMSAPGTERIYCNMGYALMGYLIEMISKKSFPEYMQSEVFGPLGMDNSYWLLSDIPHTNIARPHEIPDEETGGSPSPPRILPHYGYPDYPDGQLRTTVRDYAQVLKLMVNEGKVDGSNFLKTETIEEMLRIQFPDADKWQALAWNFNEFDHWLYYFLNPRLPAHTGVDPGVATVSCFDPATRSGAIIFLNNSPPSSFGHMKLFYMDMVKRLLKEAEK
jgi:CubicO group peptidase (beta-lactamase class C family)